MRIQRSFHYGHVLQFGWSRYGKNRGWKLYEKQMAVQSRRSTNSYSIRCGGHHSVVVAEGLPQREWTGRRPLFLRGRLKELEEEKASPAGSLTFFAFDSNAAKTLQM